MASARALTSIMCNHAKAILHQEMQLRRPESRSPPSGWWHHEYATPERIILSGKDDRQNSIYAVLDRIPEYLTINVGSPIQGQPLQYSRPFYNRYPVYDASFDGTQTFWDRPAAKGFAAP